jgi:hypothetical protein
LRFVAGVESNVALRPFAIRGTAARRFEMRRLLVLLALTPLLAEDSEPDKQSITTTSGLTTIDFRGTG